MDYAAMYFKLFHTITNVIEELQQAQKEAEEMYIEAVPDEEAQGDTEDAGGKPRPI